MPHWLPPNVQDREFGFHRAMTDHSVRSGWGGRMGDLVAAMNASANLNTCLSVAANSAFLSGDTIRPFSVSPSGRFGLDFYESETDTKPLLQGVSRTLTTANDFGRNFPTPMVSGLDNAGEGR